MDKVLGVTAARYRFSEVVKNAEDGDDTILTKHGVPIARVIPYDEYRELIATLEKKRRRGR